MTVDGGDVNTLSHYGAQWPTNPGAKELGNISKTIHFDSTTT